jgi:ABC-type phosphate/phosphonate transport system ATPase subunit
MQPRLLLQSLTFSDGTTVLTSEASIVALVGPNNSGKSSTLREIQDRACSADKPGPVLKSATFEKRGTYADLKVWLEQNVQKIVKSKRHQWRLLTAKIGVLTTTVTMIVMIFAVAVAEGLSPTRQE